MSADSGSIAHAALKLWIESGEWRNDVSGDGLVDRFLVNVAQAGADVARLRAGRLTQMRLQRRARGLATLFASASGTAIFRCESILQDSKLFVWGRPDVVVIDRHRTQLVDLKTGEHVRNDLQADLGIRFRMLLYAHLVRITYGVLPAVADVFSLKDGLSTFRVDSNEVDEAVQRVVRVRSAWMAGARPATPSPRTCSGCRIRPICDPSWQALRLWKRRDAVEGTVERMVKAENESSAVLLNTWEGTSWVTRLPPHVQSEVGDYVRVVGLRPVETRQSEARTPTNYIATDYAVVHSVGRFDHF
nr:PD-(D/E)XK nuclease family protein [Antrihabitans stalactiti]